MGNIRVLLVIVVICSIAQAADNACSLPLRLFQDRTSLTAQLDSAITEGNTALQAELQTKIKKVDQQYYRFMQAASERVGQADVTGLTACCARSPGDPVALSVCNLALFLSNGITSQQFVEQFPVSGNARQALWMLDEIANVEQGPGNLPQAFKPDGPVSLYITKLFTLIKTSDKAALKKYLELYLAADGQYAELMEDQMEHLFLQYPAIVIRNWSLFKANRRILPDLQQSLSPNQKRRVTSQARKYCSANCEPCKELSVALK